VLLLRTHNTKCVEWFYKRREVVVVWEGEGMVFSRKVMELTKHIDDKGKFYDVLLLDWSIKNYDVYNEN
jgi:hypothetical protein